MLNSKITPTLFQKLNLKDHQQIVILNAPVSFEPELAALSGVEVICDTKKLKAIEFAMAFAVTEAELNAAAKAILPKALGDAVVWIAYPKKSSKKYKCEFHRDSGWAPLAEAGFETVRMVAIDDDWSGVRFRRSEFVKAMTRDPKIAISAAGKAKTRPAAKA